MSEILLDECFKELYLAQECMNEYIEIDSYAEIFEASNEEVQKQVKHNEEVKSNTESHLKKAIQAIIDMIKKTINNIKNFFTKHHINEREKQMRDSMIAAKKKDPSISNKKIKTLDFNKMKNQSDALDREIDDACKKLDAGQDIPIDGLMNKITNFCTSGASAVTVSIGMEAALQAASSSKEMAQKISQELEDNIELQERLMNSVGKKEYKKFKKDVECMGKKISLRRKKLEKDGYCAQSFQDAINTTFNECESIFKNLGTLIGVWTANPDNNKDGSKNTLQSTASAAKHLFKNRKTVKDSIDEVKDNHGIQMLKRIAGNDDVRTVAKKAIEVSGDNSKNKRKRYLANKEYEKQAIKTHKKLTKNSNDSKKRNMSDQSMLSSMMGSYDKSSTVKDNKVANVALDVINRLNH